MGHAFDPALLPTKLDSMGRPKVKTCPLCETCCGRTNKRCPTCNYEFVGRRHKDRADGMVAAIVHSGSPVKRKPAEPMQEPIVESVTIIPARLALQCADDEFDCEARENGTMVLRFPDGDRILSERQRQVVEMELKL